MTLTGKQSRMARAALDWGVRDLAGKADINPNTISRFESGKGALTTTVDKLQAVFEAEGIRFTQDGCVCSPPARKSSL
ncbi:MAG TPA: helix-turn-helix transcriptional regulator [Lacipirellulaceae bacterium]|nr:helix-turn-helix transcriptional regulator [Lacipirellulaceae bacterium]